MWGAVLCSLWKMRGDTLKDGTWLLKSKVREALQKNDNMERNNIGSNAASPQMIGY